MTTMRFSSLFLISNSFCCCVFTYTIALNANGLDDAAACCVCVFFLCERAIEQ